VISCVTSEIDGKAFRAVANPTALKPPPDQSSSRVYRPPLLYRATVQRASVANVQCALAFKRWAVACIGMHIYAANWVAPREFRMRRVCRVRLVSRRRE
jgi:hypothetical protein